MVAIMDDPSDDTQDTFEETLAMSLIRRMALTRFFFVVRINIFQASLTDSYFILSFKPIAILRIFLFFTNFRSKTLK